MTTASTSETVVVAVTGEVDLETAPLLKSALRHALGQRPKTVIIDLTPVRFLGSAGIDVLLKTAGKPHARKTSVRVVANRPGPVARAIEVAGIDEVLTLYGSVAEAERAD